MNSIQEGEDRERKRERMNIQSLDKTKHAYDQFLERLKVACPKGVKDPEALFKKILRSARPAAINHISWKNRAIRHGQSVKVYRSSDGWRPVTVKQPNGRETLITMERWCKEQNSKKAMEYLSK